MRNIDKTKLGYFDRTIESCKVVAIPAGATPKFITVELPGDDAARVAAWYDGAPPGLLVNDYVRLRYVPTGQTQYTITGTSGGTGTASVILASVMEAKGDLIVGSGAGAVDNEPVGANTHVLTADSTRPLGVKWAAVNATVNKVVASDGAPDALTADTDGAVTIPISLVLAYGSAINEFSVDYTMSGNSEAAVPTEAAVKAYVTTRDITTVSQLVGSDGSPTGAIAADASGYLSAAVQPLFVGWRSAAASNVTGDGTNYTVVFDAEAADRNSNFNTSTGVFTAPITGRYLLCASFLIQEIGAGHTAGLAQFITSNKIYSITYVNPAVVSAGGLWAFDGNVIADMDVGDTASVLFAVYNSTKTIDLYADGAGAWCSFSGYLLP